MRKTCPRKIAEPSATKAPAQSILPRGTVTEAFRKLNDSPLFTSNVVLSGGPSGSAWLFAPSGCQTYCSAPNVASVTGPVKCAGGLPWES